MYTVLRAYDDLTSSTEHTDNISSALSAAAIYLEDGCCFTVKIWETASGKIILDYYR